MRWLALVTVALLVAPALAQQNDAEKLYRAMEKKVRDAKGLHFTFEGDVSGEGKKGKLSGTVDLAEGNKGRVTMEASFDGQTFKLVSVSDGKTAYAKFNDMVNPMPEPPGEKDFEKLSGTVARAGIIVIFVGGPKDKKAEFDLDKEFAIKDFKLGGKEKIGKSDTQAVQYLINAKDGTKINATVWIDTKTQLPVKRELKAEKDGKNFDVTETNTAFELNPTVDAKTFEIPK